MPTSPPGYTALPTPPSTTDPANFNTRGDAFLLALPTNQTEMNALAANAYTNAVETSSNTTTAVSSAASAAASAITAASSGVGWVSGTTYAIGDARWSPINYRVYRRITSGTGTTDPSADSTNWAPLFPVPTAVTTVLNQQTYGGF